MNNLRFLPESSPLCQKEYEDSQRFLSTQNLLLPSNEPIFIRIKEELILTSQATLIRIYQRLINVRSRGRANNLLSLVQNFQHLCNAHQRDYQNLLHDINIYHHLYENINYLNLTEENFIDFCYQKQKYVALLNEHILLLNERFEYLQQEIAMFTQNYL